MKKILFLALILLLFSHSALAEIEEQTEEIIQDRAQGKVKWEVSRLPLMAGDVIWATVPSNLQPINVRNDDSGATVGSFFSSTAVSPPSCRYGSPATKARGYACSFTIPSNGIYTIKNAAVGDPTTGRFYVYYPNHAARVRYPTAPSSVTSTRQGCSGGVQHKVVGLSLYAGDIIYISPPASNECILITGPAAGLSFFNSCGGSLNQTCNYGQTTISGWVCELLIPTAGAYTFTKNSCPDAASSFTIRYNPTRCSGTTSKCFNNRIYSCDCMNSCSETNDCLDSATETPADAQNIHTVSTCSADNGCTEGSATCTKSNNTDSCLDADTVTEWYVSGGNCVSTPIDCPAGETCSGGKCGAANTPPNAVIDSPAANQTITVGQSVGFAGHGTDSDGSVIAHSWACVAASGSCPSGVGGFPRSVEDPGSVTFAAVGSYNVTYNVQDDDFAWDSTPPSRVITVNPVANNAPDSFIDSPPVGASITAGLSFNFTGHGVDPDAGDIILNYEWTCAVVSGSPCPIAPAGFPSNRQNPRDITFNAEGDYTIRFRVRDNHLAWDPSPASVAVTVNPVPNAPPVADAGPDQTVQPGVLVTLSSAADGPDADLLPSYDPDTCPSGDLDGCLGYAWSCAAGSPVACPFIAPVGVGKTATFTAGADGDVYIFELETDDGALTATDIVQVAVTAVNTAPDADAGDPYVITLPTTAVVLDGSGSTDTEDCGGAGDCLALNYSWVIGDTVNTASCETSASGITPSITCTSNGTANVTLTVTDSGIPAPALSDAATSTITVNPAGTNNAPDSIIDSPADGASITAGGRFNFTGHGIDLDAGDSVVGWEWTCTVLGPSGSCPAGFPSFIEAAGSITFNSAGRYRISYRVWDGDVWDPSPATITVVVNSSAPTAFLQITAFSAEPLNFVAGETDLKFDPVSVTVKNIGSVPADAMVKLFVRDALTNANIGSLGEKSQSNISAGPGATLVFRVVDFSSLGIGPGTYKLVAEAYDQSTGELHDTESLAFSIVRPIPTPELNEFLLPLVAFAVVAILFVSGKRQKKGGLGKEVLIASLLLSALLLAGCAQPPGPPVPPVESFLTYSSSENGFSIDYPVDWELQEGIAGAAALFVSPLESDSDSFQESINVIATDLQEPMSLQQYIDFRMDSLKQAIPDFTLIDSADATLSGLPARKVVYTSENGSRKRLALLAVKGSREYAVVYAADIAKYDSFLPVAQKMVDSFKIE